MVGSKDKSMKLNKKQELRERSMARLAEAAFKLFVLNGYHATSLDAIASDAELTKGAVYFYFRSKENLALHLLDILKHEIAQPLVATIRETKGSVMDKVIKYIHCGANFGANRPYQFLFMIQMAIEFGRQDTPIANGIRAVYEEIHNALEAAVKDAQAEGTLSPHVRPREFASMIVAVHDGMTLEWHLRGEDIDGPELVRCVRQMFLHGICGN